MPASSLPVLSALKHRENLLLNPNAHGGLSSARLTATPNGCRYYRWTRGNAMQFLQVVYKLLTKSYKVSAPAIFGGPSHTG